MFKYSASKLPGLQSLWDESVGDPGVCVAVLDGPVDLSHPSFQGAQLTKLPTLVSDAAAGGQMSSHGTHIASVIFGQHGSPVQGIAPGCRGLIVPVFSDTQNRSLLQIDLARAINQAVEQGANVINISGGELSESGAADPILEKAVRYCNENDILIVAAAGNNACECLHVPAALPSVLAVGAMNDQGLPFDFSNWGKAYQTQGILAPGENILGAKPGGSTTLKSGTSFATPIVSGIVALLLSIQLRVGKKLDPHSVRHAILKSALPCHPDTDLDDRRCLAGRLNILGAYTLITKGEVKEMSEQNSEQERMQPSEAKPSETNNVPQVEAVNHQQAANLGQAQNLQVSTASGHPGQFPAYGMTVVPSQMVAVPTMQGGMMIVPNHQGTIVASGQMGMVPATPVTPSNAVTPSNVVPSTGCDCNNSGPKALVYAIGTIGYDFATEARRDSFKQLMPLVDSQNVHKTGNDIDIAVPANPFDVRQIVNYFLGTPQLDSDGNLTLNAASGNYEVIRNTGTGNLSETKSLIWTLNLELTPIYAIEATGPFAHLVYEQLGKFLEGQSLPQIDNTAYERGYIDKVSIPGVLTGRTVQLFSGQVVPVLEVYNLRGLYGWHINLLIEDVVNAVGVSQDSPEGIAIDYSLRTFLQRIYYDLRNLGQTSQERAFNYAATNALQLADALVTVLQTQSSSGAASMQLDSIEVERSPFCRVDSDCWDVKIRFFDPENDRRARKVLRYTVDVSDIMPVTLGEPRIWDAT